MASYLCYSPTLRESVKYSETVEAPNAKSAARWYFNKIDGEDWSNIPDTLTIVVAADEGKPLAFQVSPWGNSGVPHALPVPVQTAWLC